MESPSSTIPLHHSLLLFLPQHPSPEVSHADELSAEWVVNFIVSYSDLKAMSLMEIEQATKLDKTLHKLTKPILQVTEFL